MGDYYFVNGTKNWITNGSSASVYVVMAQTDRSKGARGINALIIEKNWPGVTVGAKENKMGIRGSDTHSIQFTDVKVPKENRIGKDGFGFKFAMLVLNGGRIGIAAQAFGIAAGAFERSFNMQNRESLLEKKLLITRQYNLNWQIWQRVLKQAACLFIKLLWIKTMNKDYTISSAMAKVFASETAMWVATEAVQIHGGYGYVKEYHVERMMRDAKITQIYEGTSEVQRIVIGRSLAK